MQKNGGLLKKRLAALGMVCVLSACQSTPALIPGPPDKVANFSKAAADLSDCTYGFSQSIRSPYLFRRITVRPEKEFLLMGKGSNAPTQPAFPRLELRFISQAETTMVELRETASGDHELEDEVWSVVERCSRRGNLSATLPIP